jgi:hypothetical protein
MEPKLMPVGEPGDSLTAPSGLQMTFAETPGATGGRRLVMDWKVPAGGRLVAADHLHPDGPEVWQVQEGSAGYRLAGEERSAEAPHEYAVPASTSHGHPWNAGPGTLRVRQIISSEDPIPEITGGVQGYFETCFAFAQRGGVKANGDISDRLQNALTIYALLVPGTFLAGPPQWLQRGAFASISAVARALGREPYLRPEFDGR